MIAKVKCFWSFIISLNFLKKCVETIVENLVYIICENRGFKWKLNVANVLMEQERYFTTNKVLAKQLFLETN